MSVAVFDYVWVLKYLRQERWGHSRCEYDSSYCEWNTKGNQLAKKEEDPGGAKIQSDPPTQAWSQLGIATSAAPDAYIDAGCFRDPNLIRPRKSELTLWTNSGHDVQDSRRAGRVIIIKAGVGLHGCMTESAEVPVVGVLPVLGVVVAGLLSKRPTGTTAPPKPSCIRFASVPGSD